MKFLHLLAVIGVVGLKFAAAVTCENESDPDSGYNGNWCGCDDGTCWDFNTAYPCENGVPILDSETKWSSFTTLTLALDGCNPHGPYQITCP